MTAIVLKNVVLVKPGNYHFELEVFTSLNYCSEVTGKKRTMWTLPTCKEWNFFQNKLGMSAKTWDPLETQNYCKKSKKKHAICHKLLVETRILPAGTMVWIL